VSENETDDGLGDLVRAGGPWSLDDAPADAAFFDFGPLRLPAIPTMRARMELDPATQRIGAISVHVAGCALQLQVIAAPAGVAFWSDVRRALLTELRKRPGTMQAHEGAFGPEIIATLTGRTRDGLLGDTTMRYLGVDGDGWVLRAVAAGPGVTTDASVARMDAFVSQCAVAMPDDPPPAGTVMELSAPQGERAPDTDDTRASDRNDDDS
jgi:hypothetical protein